MRFVNLLMNDTTYLISDALTHLGQITERQRMMDNEEVWSALPATERQEKEKELRGWESAVRSDLDLGVESLRLLKLFSKETTSPFLTPEIVDRLAAMLDANLALLAGPKCQELKVKNPEAYKFRPKELLSDVLTIFQHLGPFEPFERAVAKDGRSYSKGLFERAVRIARKTAIKTEDEIEALLAFVAKVEAIKLAEEEEDAMGEVPDEFQGESTTLRSCLKDAPLSVRVVTDACIVLREKKKDPLTYEIMRDPVILPVSRTVIDRSSIKQHYLSDRTDPFNRQPFEWEDIVDAVELRLEIEQWLQERRRNRQQQQQQQGSLGSESVGSTSQERDKMQVD